MSEGILSLSAYIADAFVRCPPLADYATPWDMSAHAVEAVRAVQQTLGAEFAMVGEVAVHRGAVVEAGAVIRGPAVVSDELPVRRSRSLRPWPG